MLLVGDKIILKKPIGKLRMVGKILEIANVITVENNQCQFIARDNLTKVAVGSFSFSEIEDNFIRYSDIYKWSDWCPVVEQGSLCGYYKTNGKRVIFKTIKGNKGKSSCNLQYDDFNLEKGIHIAYLRAKQKELTDLYYDNERESDNIKKDLKEVREKLWRLES